MIAKILGTLFFLVFFYLAIKSRTSKHRRGMKGSGTAKSWRRNYVGALGEQIHIAVTYVDRKRFDSNGRGGYRYRFRDGQGHCLVWFTSYATLIKVERRFDPVRLSTFGQLCPSTRTFTALMRPCCSG